MGLVHGAYDAKAEGFAPGGCSLHNCMTGHGPDAATFEKASGADLSKPDVITDTMAFMFETRTVIAPTRQAAGAARRQRDYQQCWAGQEKPFAPPRRPGGVWERPGPDSGKSRVGEEVVRSMRGWGT